MKSTVNCTRWVVAIAIPSIMLAAWPALAGVGISIAPDYPNVVDVGETGLPATLRISNGADGLEATDQLLITNIQHTPACGVSDFPCPAGQRDPGVFDVNSPATGSEACAGMMFNVSITDASTGTVTFVPQSGSVILQPRDTPNDTCVISFTVDVLKVPTHDASASPGLMTNQLARAAAQAVMQGTTGSGTGTSQTTVRAPREQCIDCRREVPAVGPGAMAALALLLVGGGFGAIRRRRSVAA